MPTPPEGPRGPRLRPARPEDAEALATLCGQLGYPSETVQVARRLRSIGTRPDHAVLVAVDGAKLLGWVHVFVTRLLETDARAEIGGLVVDEACRGRGLGKALVRGAEAWARSYGLRLLRVRTNVTRERAHRFYEREGFREEKRQIVLMRDLPAPDKPPPPNKRP
jgi:GNAT superfamily N-acetyltransferase